MAWYKDMLEEKMRRFNELKQQEEASLRPLEFLPTNWKALDKIEQARAQLQEVFEIYYEDLYNSHEETAKPEELSEEPMPEQFIEDKMPDIRVVDNSDREIQLINNTESDEDEEKGKVWVCPNCWCADHEPGAKFCHMCGTLISSGTKEGKDMDENDQLRVDFENEEETEQAENAEVEENGQLRIPFKNEGEAENDEK